MANDQAEQTDGVATEAPHKTLTPAAERALAEAAARRADQEARQAALGRTPERHGRGGLDPVRYDDWEVKGLAADF
jgi:hypothetical protein